MLSHDRRSPSRSVCMKRQTTDQNSEVVTIDHSDLGENSLLKKELRYLIAAKVVVLTLSKALSHPEIS